MTSWAAPSRASASRATPSRIAIASAGGRPRGGRRRGRSGPQRVGVVGAELRLPVGEPLLAGLDRLVGPPGPGQHLREPVPLDESRDRAGRPRAGGDRVGEAALIPVGAAELGMGVGEARIEANGLPILGDRLVDLLLALPEGLRELEVGRRRAGVDADGPAIGRGDIRTRAASPGRVGRRRRRPWRGRGGSGACRGGRGRASPRRSQSADSRIATASAMRPAAR